MNVRYPCVDLFLYNLQDGLGQVAEEHVPKRKQLWYGILNGQLSDDVLKQIEQRETQLSSYIELLPQRVQLFGDSYDGYYYPVKLGDTVAIQIDCGGRPDDPAWKELELQAQLNIIKEGLLDHAEHVPSDLGSSWLIWGQLTTADQSPSHTARELFTTLGLFSKPDWEKGEFKGRGSYQGSHLFEIQQVDETADGVNKNQYCLILLFPSSQTESVIKATIGQFYRHVIRLFHYRNKILWAHEQGFQLKTQLKNAQSNVQSLTQNLSSHITQPTADLNSLQQDLTTALTLSYLCERTLNSLETQASTIAINLENYQERLQRMKTPEQNSDLAFLEEFSEFAREKYQKQLEVDVQALSNSFKPLTTFIQTVEGIINIEKAKNDRTLNRTVAIASVGISVASLAASTLNEEVKNAVLALEPTPSGQKLPISTTLKSASLALGVSLAIGILGALITWILFQICSRRK